jgi:hypothetical protein
MPLLQLRDWDRNTRQSKQEVCGWSKVGKHDLHNNVKNGDQTWKNEIPCQSIFLKRNQVANGHLIVAAYHRRCENRRRQWPTKVPFAGRGVEVVPPWLGGALCSGKPPVPQRSTPEFLDCPSGYQLKGEENGGKSLPCRENVATA